MRRLALAGLVLAALALVLVWRCHGDAGESRPTARPAPPGAVIAKRDPRTLPKSSLAGTVHDDAGTPVAGARVCARGRSQAIPTAAILDARCATSDATGGYRLEGLVPMTYGVAAMAASFQPARHPNDIALATGQALTGIDVTLPRGGVPLTGVVNDITGGPIAHALVAVRFNRERYLHAAAGVAVETDEQGKFALWAEPGSSDIEAAAEGYTSSTGVVIAPGSIDLFLMPESTVAGTVIDAASGAPIEGARIVAERANVADDPIDISDAGGHFRFSRLPPERYTVTAHAPHGYGQASSTTLGLGAHTDGIVVRVFPAMHVDGRVLADGSPCSEPQVTLADDVDHRWFALERVGDVLETDELPPGTYRPEVDCAGFDARDRYEPLVLVDRDVSGIVWSVDRGGGLRGRVLDSAGGPVAGALVTASQMGGARRFADARSASDGAYELRGLRTGAYTVWCTSDRGAFPNAGVRVDVATPATVQRDLVLDATGEIRGNVVDAEGRAVARVLVSAQGTDRDIPRTTQTDDTGGFTIVGVRPGGYEVTSRSASTLPAAAAHATVTAGQIANVRLAVVRQTATIWGSVVDPSGQPVGDAFIEVAADSEHGSGRPIANPLRWSWDARPVVTASDGTFVVDHLAVGSYTVRAYRKGGSEALEHVATGSTVRLRMKPTGSIEGVVHPGNDIALTISDPVRHEEHTEQLFHVDGRFALRHLAAGHYVLTAAANASKRSVELDLVDGENRTGIVIELAPQLTLTGRVVDAKTKQPIPGARVFAMSPADVTSMRLGRDPQVIADATGRFIIEDRERGELTIGAWAGELSTGSDLKRTVPAGAPSPYDLGDIALIHLYHLKRGDPVGQLGAKVDGAKVISVDPQGAAAKAGLVAGDILTAIEGYDVTGDKVENVRRLLRAPPGTRLALGLARGAAVSVTLAAP